MATSSQLPWSIVAGDVFRTRITWYQGVDDNGDPSGPVNLTGYAGRCQGRLSAAATPASWEVDDADIGGVTLGGVAGTVDVELTAEITAALAGQRGVWAVELTEPGGQDLELLRGEWVCESGIVYDDPEPEP